MAALDFMDTAPAHARSTLQRTFARTLHVPAGLEGPDDGTLYPDEDVLWLLDALTLSHSRTVASARALYADIQASESTIPTFDELHEAGWLRVARGRVYPQIDPLVTRKRAGALWPALLQLGAALCKREFSVSSDASVPDLVVPLLERMVADPERFRHVRCRTPTWVAARLWERCMERGQDTADGLGWWEDRWRLLGCPTMVPRLHMPGPPAMAFVDVAMSVLQEPEVALTWSEIARRRAMQRAYLDGNAQDEREDTVPHPLIERVEWLLPVGSERDEMALHDGAPAFYSVLLCALADQGAPSLPGPLREMMAFIAERPELLTTLKTQLVSQPSLYADMCITPVTAPLACLWLTEARPVYSYGDHDTALRVDELARSTAFGEALQLVGRHLESRALPALEVAPLARILMSRAGRRPDGKVRIEGALSRSFHDMLGRQNRDVLDLMVGALAAGATQDLRTAPFLAAALEVAADGLLFDTTHTRQLVTAYSTVIRSHGAPFLLARITPRSAATLARIALRASNQVANAFLYAVDIRAMVDADVERGENRYAATDQASRSLRAHVRFLCRAVAGWTGSPPQSLVAALAANVREGIFETPATNTEEASRTVDIFSSRFEVSFAGESETPLSGDMAPVLHRVSADERQTLVDAVLRTREPAFLAALVPIVPESVKDRLAGRVSELSVPGAAEEIHTLLQLQLRIDRLLGAGHLDEAEKAIAEEAVLKTMGTVPGRGDARLRALLRMYFRKGEFERLRRFQAGADGTKMLPQTEDLVDFYRALAWMQAPGASMDYAADIFDRLRHKDRTRPAYTVNYLAAKSRQLLGDDVFGHIPDHHRDQTRMVLADGLDSLASLKDASPEDRDLIALSLSQLYLATGVPARALDLLSTIRTQSLEAPASGYSAVALQRLGRTDAARAALETLTSRSHDEGLVHAVAAQLDRGEPYNPRTTPVSQDTSSTVSLQHFLAMPPHERAAALMGGELPEHKRAIGELRDSATALQDLTSVLKSGAMHPGEDDITSLFAKLLTVRASPLDWVWREQPRGGITANGNAGSRDLTLTHGNITYAIAEAVVVDKPIDWKWTQGELLSHYLKLFAYGRTALFFEVVYSFDQPVGPTLDSLRRMAHKSLPSGATFVGITDLEDVGNLVPGLVAEYTTPQKRVFVVFLVVDLQLAFERKAANASAEANPRKPKAAKMPRTARPKKP